MKIGIHESQHLLLRLRTSSFGYDDYIVVIEHKREGPKRVQCVLNSKYYDQTKLYPRGLDDDCRTTGSVGIFMYNLHVQGLSHCYTHIDNLRRGCGDGVRVILGAKSDTITRNRTQILYFTITDQQKSDYIQID
jgi:hypothetical protein